MTLDAYNQLMWGLKGKAAEAPSVFEAAILLRDACAFAYLWETGQRGAELCVLKVTDFMYEDIECTPCGDDIVTRQLDPRKRVVVERSGGTKTWKSRRPGNLQLERPRERGDGQHQFKII